MKKLFLFALLLAGLHAQAQKLDSVKIGGSQYYVYPYPQVISASGVLAWAMDPITDLKSLDLQSVGLTEKEMRDYILMNYGIDLKAASSKAEKSRIKVLRANADRFYEVAYDLESDIVPALDNLPDGKYIQYFSEYRRLNQETGDFDPDGLKIAGYFELKNNLLEGNAYWLGPTGDTLKQGKFRNGLKEGAWTLRELRLPEELDTKKKVEDYLVTDPVYEVSTSTFANGVLNGAYEKRQKGLLSERGQYTDGKESGEWFMYTESLSFGKDTSVLTTHYTIADQEIVSHRPFIRSYDPDYSNLPYKYYDFGDHYEAPSVDLTSVRYIAGRQKNSMELPEEEINAYEGDMYDEGKMPYMERGSELMYSQYVYLDGRYVSQAKIVDSIGIVNKYKDVYEEFHENGKLKIRMVFENGDLVDEGTIFWEDGKPADMILYHPETKEYENRKLDYTGVPYDVKIYDSTGLFIRQELDPFYKDKHVLIGGLDAETVNDFYASNAYDPNDLDYYESETSWDYFDYDNSETLTKSIQGNVIIEKSWYPDTTVRSLVTYNAEERLLNREVRSLNGKLKESSYYEFDDHFNTVRGKSEIYFKELTLSRTFNGNYPYAYLQDSFPAVRAAYPEENYEMTAENILSYKNVPFSGKITFSMKSKSPSFSISKNKIAVGVSDNRRFYRKYAKDYAKFRRTGKSKYDDLLSLAIKPGVDYQGSVLEVFPFLQALASPENIAAYDYYAPAGKKAKRAEMTRIEGSFLGGKPGGTWKVFDQYGKLMLQTSFLNGEQDGNRKDFAYENPAEDFSLYAPRPAFDTLPSKATYYLAVEGNYKNGVKSGTETEYDWRGNVLSRATYTDGYNTGSAYEHNAIATVRSNYENGALDGIVQTTLHLPGRDSILLYELNFQNGSLQGESRGYHTNGKLAKRGFFLGGMPIDDYEGYDSLGTRIHYVKFQYSYPVEEKIWEENELSVRYQFDWRDSIYFVPNDIVEATTVDNLLYQYGLLGDQYAQPYLGRPSLVDKSGIDYHMTKYFPNDTVSRDGSISSGRKVGCWQFFSYDGEKLYDVEYYDTVITLNDTIQFKSKGMLYDYDAKGNLLSKSYIIEKFEKYDCSHTDHYEIRQFYTIWQAHDSLHRINGYVKNYYDNGTLQSEGTMRNGLPEGIWKYYDPFGKLNHAGVYVLGKRDGRWLSGDLSKTKYLGDICMNPNLPDLEEHIRYQEKMLDIYIRYFKSGKLLQSEYYGLNLNDFEQPETETE